MTRRHGLRAHLTQSLRFAFTLNDLVHVLRTIGCKFDEAALRAHRRVNVSEMMGGEPIWDPELRERILAPEAPALRRFYPDAQP